MSNLSLADAIAELTNVTDHLRRGMTLLTAGSTEEAVHPFESADASLLRLSERQRSIQYLIEFGLRMARRDHKTAARKAFDVAELTELILADLDNGDLLRMMQVDRTSRNTIMQSTVLQRKLHLLPDANAHLRLLPVIDLMRDTAETDDSDDSAIELHHGHGRAHYLDYQGPPEQALRREHRQVIASFHGRLPRLGSRIRSMLISQPPLTEMCMNIGCCCPMYGPPGRIQRDRGITLGDLYDFAERLIAQHENCPFAHPNDHNADGTVKVCVTFQATATLRDDDTYILRKPVEYCLLAEETQEAQAASARMKAFAKRNRIAWAQDLPIPTLEQFSPAAASV
ncbi:hypothetical protein LTR27_006345 [Elasticomyces elasticus]|nr:hypothetical protein LTR27_006345 [Elasticomyces elasticus]